MAQWVFHELNPQALGSTCQALSKTVFMYHFNDWTLDVRIHYHSPLQFSDIAFLPFKSSRSHRNVIRTRTPPTKIIRYTTSRHLDTCIARDDLAIVLWKNVCNQQVAAHAWYIEVGQARPENLVVACSMRSSS